jgi:glycosyltransferase involved in cell wall biosynthesis
MKERNKKLKILLLCYEYPPIGGGGGNVAYEEATTLEKLGHRVTILTTGYKDLPKIEKKQSTQIYRINCFRAQKNKSTILEMLLYITKTKQFLRKYLKNNTFDFCHAHFLLPTGIVANWLKNKYNLPYVITAHGSDVPKHNTKRFKLAHTLAKPTLINVCKGAKYIISPTNYLEKLIIQNIGKFKKKIIIINNKVNTTRFLPKKKEKIILASGRLTKQKHLDLLIKAAKKINLGYTIHILGDGPEKKKLEKLSKNTKTKVIFHGAINNNSNQYKAIFGKAAIYVSTALNENARISLLEAMSAGCAVIARSTGGSTEIAPTKKWLYSTDEEFYQKLKNMCGNQTKIKNLGKLGRNKAITKFDSKNGLKDYKNLLKRII